MHAKSECVCTCKCVYSRVSVCFCVQEYVLSTYAHLLRHSRKWTPKQVRVLSVWIYIKKKKWALRACVCLYVYEYIYIYITNANLLNCSRNWAPRVSMCMYACPYLIHLHIYMYTCIYVYAHQLRGSRREMPQIYRYRCIHTHVHPILANILSIFCQFFVNIWYWHAILHGVSTLCRLPKLLGLFSKKNPIIVGLFGKRNLVIWRSIKIYHPTHRNTRNERWGAGVETQKNVRGVFKGWGRVPFNETYAPSLSTIYDEA